jgi:RNA polymerase sigma-70 factor (ECF subfamily)
VELVLARFLEDTAVRYSSLSIEAHAYARFVGERLVQSGRSLGELARLHGADLALTWACTGLDKVALQIFDSSFLRKTATYVRRADADVDEIAQRLREKLLVAKPGALPRIADYLGTGPLEGFVRIAAVRCAISLKRSQLMWRFTEDKTLDGMASGTQSPESSVAQAQLSQAARLAFAEAAKTLTHKQRQLIRFYHLEDSTLDQLALVYDVHLSTVARWIEQARVELREATFVALQKALPRAAPSAEELEGALDHIIASVFSDPGLV